LIGIGYSITWFVYNGPQHGATTLLTDCVYVIARIKLAFVRSLAYDGDSRATSLALGSCGRGVRIVKAISPAAFLIIGVTRATVRRPVAICVTIWAGVADSIASKIAINRGFHITKNILGFTRHYTGVQITIAIGVDRRALIEPAARPTGATPRGPVALQITYGRAIIGDLTGGVVDRAITAGALAAATFIAARIGHPVAV
jgi:hypothetical protein